MPVCQCRRRLKEEYFMFDVYTDENGNWCKFFRKYEDVLEMMKPGNSLEIFINGGLFRGQGEDWPLVPSLYRDNYENSIVYQYDDEFKKNNPKSYYAYIEYQMLKFFYEKANYIGLDIPRIEMFDDDYLKADFVGLSSRNLTKNDIFTQKNVQELAALAQHYSVPTRMLDWTQDIFVAFYFAAIGALAEIDKNGFDKNKNMVIWCVSSVWLTDDACNVYKPPIKLVVPSYYQNINIRAQKGVTMFYDNFEKSDNETLAKVLYKEPFDLKFKKYYDSLRLKRNDFTVKFSKILIPTGECIKILENIDKLGYNTSALFPWYDGIARDMKDKYLVNLYKDKIPELSWYRTKHFKTDIKDVQGKKSITIKCSKYKVSAGVGFNVSDPEWYDVEVEYSPEAEKSDFCVEIFGDSMLPKYSNGDFVLVKSDVDITDGCDCIYVIDGKGYLKRFRENKLQSLNPEYDDIIPSAYDENSVYPMGKVIGKAKVLSTV